MKRRSTTPCAAPNAGKSASWSASTPLSQLAIAVIVLLWGTAVLHAEVDFTTSLADQSLKDVVAKLKAGDLKIPASFSGVPPSKQATADASAVINLLERHLKSADGLPKNRITDVDDLDQLYRALSPGDTYMAMALRDATKMCVLWWGREHLITSGVDDDTRKCRQVLRGMALDPQSLGPLYGRNTEAGWLQDGRPTSNDYAVVLPQIFKSHGQGDNDRRMGFLLPHSTRQLVETPDSLKLLFNLMQTEAIRRVHFEGSIAFLEKGGELEKVSSRDVTYFQEFMKESAKEFGFAPMGIRKVDALNVAQFMRSPVLERNLFPDLSMFVFHRFPNWDEKEEDLRRDGVIEP